MRTDPDTPRRRAAELVATMLPSCVESVEAFDDTLVEPLFPLETLVIASSVDKRRREFTTARGCARAAMASLGLPRSPILPGPGGAPGWPVGVVGSLTHCDGYRAAAVARSGDIAAIGIDAEPHSPLPDGVLAAVALPQELGRLATLADWDPLVCWDRLLFSAKESVYKAWYPMTGRWLDFEQADVTVTPGGGFTAHLLTEGPTVGARQLTGFTGRWLAVDGLIITAVVEPAA